MTYERRVSTEVENDPVLVDPNPAANVPAATVPAATVPTTHRSAVVETTNIQPSGGEMLRRGVVLIFGIIQAFIVLRIVLLLLNAREGNDLVAFILNTSQLFVAPFVGIFNKDALASSGSILDIAAIAALVGWTILEVVVIWAVNMFKREPV